MCRRRGARDRETCTPTAAEEPEKKKRFDPFADLPPPKKKAAPAPKPPTPEPEEKALVGVYESGLFKLNRSTACTSCASTRTRGTRRPGATRRRIDRTRQDATDELKMRTKFLPVFILCPLVFARRGDGVLVDNVASMAYTWPIIRGLAAPQWARPYSNARPRESAHARIQRPHTRENAIDTTRHRRNTRSADAPAPPLQSSPAPGVRLRKKGGDLGMFRRGKMSAAFELAAFTSTRQPSKTVARRRRALDRGREAGR